MASKTELIQQQRQWAISKGLDPDSRGYLNSVESNLLRTLSNQTKQAFENGSGSELQDTATRPAKMRALHSSSALAVNVFDSWVGKNTLPLKEALGLDSDIVSISFEEKFSTGLPGIPPNLDVELDLSTGHVIGIESKFSEWLTPKSRSKAPFKEKYFEEGAQHWKKKGLPCSQELASAMFDGRESFRYLDAPQLLKHALGLATQLTDRFSLFYLYYDYPGPESEIHKREIGHFMESVGNELRFRVFTYQELVRLLSAQDSVDQEYLDYLHERYFTRVS